MWKANSKAKTVLAAITLFTAAVALGDMTTTAPQVRELVPTKAGVAAPPEVLFNVGYGGSALAPQQASLEELSLYIQTQIVLMKTPEFFEQIFQTNELRNFTWSKQFKDNAEASAALRKVLLIERVPNTSLIRVTLAIEDHRNVEAVLNKIAEQYAIWIDQASAAQRERDMKMFRDQRDIAEKNLTRAQTEADDFRSLHDIGALTKTVDLTNDSLRDFERELNKLVVDRNLAQNMVDSVMEVQKDSGYKIPSEAMEKIERDPAYRRLDDLRMSLERSQAVAIKEKADSSEALRLKTELEFTTKQLWERYEKLALRAKEQQLTSATDTLTSINIRILDVKKRHDEKQAEVRHLDNDLVAYRSREEAVSAARAEYNRAQSEYTKQDAVLRSTQSRIQLVSRAKVVNP